MRRTTSRRVALHKNKLQAKRRDVAPANRPMGKGSLYEEIKARGGVARVCVIRSVGGIGDMLMTTPLLRQLKREFPQVHISYAIDRHRTSNDTYYQLLFNAPFIDEIIDARYVDRGAFHAITDISSVCIAYERRGLPALNRIDLFARACGINRLRNKIPFYSVEPQERTAAEYLVARHRAEGKQIVVLHSASFEDKRSWRPKNQLELIEFASVAAPQVHFLVSDFNHVLGDLGNYTNCTDISNTQIRDLAALISVADLFIGPDSGPMHLAGAMGIRSLVAFGSVPPSARINYYETHKAVISKGLSCLGCWYEACPIQIKCMKDITGIMMYERMIEELKNVGS